MSEEKKNIELKDEDLEKVSGGRIDAGRPFTVLDSWPSTYSGEWFKEDYEHECFAYNVFSSGDGNDSFMANRFWYKDGETWPYGTCSFNWKCALRVIETPTIIHTDFTGTKPF